ncbi:MYG1 exonuclease-like isoform X2 [Babylonia areolata]
MSVEPAKKKARSMAKIGTHNGTFHCDEVLACFMLKQLPVYKDAEIVRTRDPKLLEECDVVVDVGGVYNPESHHYDHHQRSFTETMNSLQPEKKWVTKLSSAGLVYLHFGHDILAQLLELPSSDPVTDLVYNKVYENFVEEVDAIDNGINATDEEPRYKISTNLSSRVGGCNPKWNEKNVDETACFQRAFDLVGAEFLDRVNYYKTSWLPARDVVLKAVNARKEVDSSGQIMVMDEGGAPWKDHLFTIEEELSISPPIKYVLYADNNGNWRVQCVPLKLGSFDNRLSLPEEWRGLRDQELSTKSGIPDCIFVHASGFIGGHKTYNGALTMAQTALKLAEKCEA